MLLFTQETIRTIRDREPRSATLTFTQLLGSGNASKVGNDFISAYQS